MQVFNKMENIVLSRLVKFKPDKYFSQSVQWKDFTHEGYLVHSPEKKYFF